ncbi:hypothetical protein EJ357_45080 [Streptomyces cyaneochromogenes]|uniref:Uncharacterized protein n=1 Tax=Streptomyces cyaneochromogenes TaxID=2496836 RepID=A0A3Q9EUZ4_9ACTN|nr:hypothetical protein EJ357_45080 [Streptomyces cyaneochromogenes]
MTCRSGWTANRRSRSSGPNRGFGSPDTGWQWRDTGAVVLVLVYALPRWGSGREIVLGVAVRCRTPRAGRS